MWVYKLEFCTASNNGRQKIGQKICQKISVIKTNYFDWELLTFDDIKEIVHVCLEDPSVCYDY